MIDSSGSSGSGVATATQSPAPVATPSHLYPELPYQAHPNTFPKLHLQQHHVDSFLDTTHQATPPRPTRLPSQHYCCQASIIGSSPDRSHVLIIPVPCKSWDCPRCGPKKRSAWIDRIITGNPTRELTLTCPANKFPTAHDAARAMKDAFAKLVQRIRRRFGDFHYALVWELTHRGTPHAHILFRGSYIPKKWISIQWTALGLGPVCFITTVASSAARATHAAKYLAKATGQTAAALAPLHLVQVSKHYCNQNPPSTHTKKYPDYSWTLQRDPPEFVAQAFLQSGRFYDVRHGHDGTIEIWLSPSKPELADVQTPKLWITSPDWFGAPP